MKKNQDHILFLPRWYPNQYDHMWGLFVRKHAEAVAPYCHISVLYLHPVDKGLKKEEWIEEQTDSLYTLYIYYPKHQSKIKYFQKFFQIYLEGFKHINRRKKINLIHVHVLTRMGLLAFLSSVVKSIPFVITEHWSRYLPTVKVYKGWLRRRLTELVVRTSKAVMPVTLNLKNAMISNGLTATKYIIVPNVVDDLFFKSNLTSSKTNLKRIIHVSTFEDRSKNISGIIDAIKTIAHHRTDFKMVFIGDGIDFERMIQKVKLLELTDRIEFTCLLEKEALVNEFEKASFLLINSNYENMPVVINEAFACGLPVLSTDVGGISEHVSLERGRLIQPRQPKQLVEQIHWMLDHYMDFNSSEIRKYAEAHFSMDAVGKQLQQIYKTALNK